MFKYNGTEVAHVFFDGLDIDIVNVNGVKVFEAVRKTEYDPVLMTRTVTPYGEATSMDMDVQEGGHIDTANIVTSGSITVSNISVSGNRLSFKTSSCSKGITGKIQVPVVECNDYFDYLIPIDLDSCAHPSSKLAYHSGSSATCTASGYSAYYTCSCDAANHTLNSSGDEISTYIAPLGHSFTSQSTTSTYQRSSANCTTAATYYYKCSRCSEKGTSYYSYGSALGHSYSSTTIYSESRQLRTAATCTAAATYWRECDRCTVHSTTQYFSSGSALGHNYVNYKCSRCGDIIKVKINSISPGSKTVSTGTNVHFSISATGYNLSYQWYYKTIGQDSSFKTYSKSSSFDYTFWKSYAPQGISWYCIVTDGYGNTATSSTITVTPV